MMRFSKWIVLLGFTFTLISCGGGGSDNGGNNNSLTLDTHAVNFSAIYYGSLPGAQDVGITVTAANAAYILAGYPPDGTTPSWLHLTLTGTGTDWTLSIRPTSTSSLSLGTHHATVRVVIADINQNVIGYQDIAVTYTLVNGFEVTPTQLIFNYSTGGSLPPNQYLFVGGHDFSWSASADQPWVTLGTSSDRAPTSVAIGVDPSGMTSGTYTATITFTDGSDSIDVGVTFTVANDLNASPQTLNFSCTNGDSAVPFSQTVTIGGYGRVWTAAASQSWVTLSDTSGTSPSTLQVGIDPTGMASGTYPATVTLAAGSESIDVDLTLTVTAPSFGVTPGTVILGGSDGMSFSAQPLQFSLSTGSNAYPWTATLTTDSGIPWLTADATSGTVSNLGTSINVDGDLAAVSNGTHDGTVVLNATVNGDIVSANVPVTFNIEAHRLFVGDNGIALASTPSLSKLSHTVTVLDTYGWTTPWSASSDQAWLTVTSTGSTGDDLTVTADPAIAVSGAVNYATVTLTSSDTTIENSETIEVGFWVNGSDPTSPIQVDAAYNEVAVDAIRPYAYVHDGGTDIAIYNVYTGALVDTIADVATELGPMAASSDGLILYATDLQNSEIVPVDLATQTVGFAWVLPNPPTNMRITYARPKGHEIVLASDGHAYDALNGTQLGATFNVECSMVVDQASTFLIAQRNGQSPARLYRYDMDYSALEGRGLRIEYVTSRYLTSYANDLALSPDDTRVYSTSDAFYYYDADTLTSSDALLIATYPNNIHVAPNGLVYCGTMSYYGPLDLWVYDTDNTELMSDYVSGYAQYILPRQLTVSEDGLRIIVLTSDPSMQFITGP